MTLPIVFIVVGIVLILTGSQTPTDMSAAGYVFIAAGVVWLIMAYQRKKKDRNRPAEPEEVAEL